MNTIWREHDDYMKLAPLTDAMVQQAEEQLQVKLPVSYVELLKQQNGGYIHYDSFPTSVPTSWADDHVHVDHFLGIAEGSGLLESPYFIKEWDLPNDVVLISGDGHSWIAFDYRQTKEEPPVLYIDVDADQLIELAPDFTTFLNGLYVETRDIEEQQVAFNERPWSRAELEAAFASNDEQQMMFAMNNLYAYTEGNELFIEQQLLQLFENASLSIKQLAATFAMCFNDRGVLSKDVFEQFVISIQNDVDLADYAELLTMKNK